MGSRFFRMVASPTCSEEDKMRYDNYKNRNCLIFGANSVIGRKTGGFLSQHHANLGLIDLEPYKETTLVERLNGSRTQPIYKTVTSGDRDSLEKKIEEIDGSLGGLDYLICSYYLETTNAKIDPGRLSLESWDDLFQEWLVNYFLVMKAVVPRMIKTGGGRIVFINTTAGYTGEGEGEGELTDGRSIYENACASGITGMMTSIARDTIPQGVSVNGIALGPDYEKDLERVIWATHLWLSGMGEYSCGQTMRLY